MDAILKFVSGKTGLSEENARAAIDAVISYFHTKLPKPVMDLIEKAVS